jgi:hypothetical protein
MRFLLAFSCFFRLLFGFKLPREAVRYLPEDAQAALPAPGAARDEQADEQAVRVERVPEPARPAEAARPAEPAAPPAAEARPAPTSSLKHQRDGALALLALLQREGRLIDFLLESIDEYDDSDIGAAVRDIHRGCRKAVSEHLTLEPIMPGDEDAPVTVQDGFDPAEIRLAGNVTGKPPFRGVLRHHGWRAIKAELPVLADGVDRRVIAPAEVEVS